MKIKDKTYYKRYYKDHYSIWCIDNELVYIIADMRINEPIYKRDKKYKLGTIKELQHDIDYYSIKVEEISKEDVFLELL